MKSIGSNLIINIKAKEISISVAGLLLADAHKDDVRYIEAEVVSVGNEVEGIKQKDKIYFVEDPIFSLDEIITQNKNSSKNLLAIGRLTRQKNFSFLIRCFKIIDNKYPNQYKLNILGEGEERNNLEKLISELHLLNKVSLVGYQSNVKNYFKDSFCFILSSLWEDPGFVLIESAINRTFILSSDCPNGPKEFLEDNKGGILFKSNDTKDFIKNFDLMLSFDDLNKNKIINYSIEKAKAYSFEKHYKKIFPILNL